MKLGFVQAVTQAVAYDSDNWLLHMPRKPSKPGRFGSGEKALSTSMQSALQEHTHDQLDAAHMRLCLDADDTIRRIYLEGW